ncbi:MAG: hypothetical protein PVG30_02045 [Gammaproteobacteria bacterium]|jgi:hypothetical protein
MTKKDINNLTNKKIMKLSKVFKEYLDNSTLESNIYDHMNCLFNRYHIVNDTEYMYQINTIGILRYRLVNGLKEDLVFLGHYKNGKQIEDKGIPCLKYFVKDEGFLLIETN